jgi:DNA-directed RNA polymerase specialized sigma24 family protein
MSHSAVPDPDLLLRHASFVRALARRLAADESSAEDLVQDTWLAVLERPSSSVRSPRSWLGGVLANLWRQGKRAEARRLRREQESARHVELSSSPDTLGAASSGRELTDMVFELEEPFRTAVLLRFYEDLPPRSYVSSD